jgi:hypothetical protein
MSPPSSGSKKKPSKNSRSSEISAEIQWAMLCYIPADTMLCDKDAKPLFILNWNLSTVMDINQFTT